MRCFTVSDITQFDGFTLFEYYLGKGKGIGMGGNVASIPENGLFPEPDISPLRSSSHNPGTRYNNPVGLIRNANIFQFSGKPENARFYALVILEQDNNSTDALLLWIVDDNTIYNFEKIFTTGDTTIYVDSAGRWSGYWQCLTKMTPGSSVIGNNKWVEVTITWDGQDLNISKKSK